MKNSDLELQQTNVKSSGPKANGNSETKNEHYIRISWLSKIRTGINFLSVEPFLVCFVLADCLSSLAVQRLNLEKACRVDLNQTKEKCDELETNVTALTQAMVADMTTWQIPFECVLPAIVILFVGAWSDRTGNRKLLMLIPMFGELICMFGLLFATYYLLEWPLFTTALIEAVPSAICGGFTIALMGACSHLADITSLESRTVRIGFATVIVSLGAPAAISVSGILLDAIGYYGIFGLSSILYVVGLLYTCMWVHDVKPIKIEGTWYKKLRDFAHPKNAWDSLSMVCNSSPLKAKVIIILAVYMITVGPAYGSSVVLYPFLLLRYKMDDIEFTLFFSFSCVVSISGEGAMLYQYLLLKYKMDDVEISLFFTYSILVGLVGTAVAVTLFSKYMKLHDALLGIISTVCTVMSSFVYALAPSKSWFYSGPAFDFFGGTAVTAIRSLGTKVVAPEEVAKMCSLIGLVEAIAPVIYTPIYSQMYKATLETLPGAFYLLSAALTSPAFVLFLTLYVLYKKEERDTVKNPKSKEMYAHENQVTEF